MIERFFEALFARDPGGGSWLGALLAAAPCGRERLGELVESPGWLQTQLAVRGAGSGRLGCFDYPAAAPRELLRWYIDHPERLTWPSDSDRHGSPHAVVLRRALLDDDPPGARVRAQERARELLPRTSTLTPEWWRFEDAARLDCVLLTDRLVVAVAAEPLTAPTPWYPPRTQIVRVLEAARHLARDGTRRYAALVLSERPLAEADDTVLAASLPEAAPHLDDAGRQELRGAYLGNLTWAEACEAIGVPRSSLPDAA